ncbi:hypothetical protein ACFVH9_08520 [Streptomyces hirsutus]|uniref:TRADD-N-associated membrane domain-containing protein n=1 Tax=Streptomyces hirsutus TaxID=35620 RepID=UPI0036348615
MDENDRAVGGRRVLLPGFLLATAVVVSAVGDVIFELFSPEMAVVTGGALASALGGLTWFGVVQSTRREEQGIQASRARVRHAERDLEAALRGAQSPETEEASVRPGEEDGAAATRPAAQAERVLQPLSRLTLPELWAVTHTRLDLYHDIATGQARRSFRNAQAAMVIGFVLLVVFVAVALNASTAAGSVVAGGLGAVSAALAGFVSRTFVKSQEAAAAHLRAYFDQPLEFSRYLAAERLIGDAGLSEEQRAEVLTALVQAMVAPSAAPQVPGVGPDAAA